MAGPTKGGDSRPSNPFGNYSFMEAQQTTSAPATAFGAKAEPPVRQAAKENPFGNYSFKDAQQHGGNSAAIEPASPTDTTAGYQFSEATRLDSNTGNYKDYNTTSAQPNGLSYTQQQQQQQQIPVLRAEDSADRSGYSLDMADTAYQPPNQQQHGASSGYIEQYAIRVLYEEFRDRAAAKIEHIVELRLDREPELAKYLETGADPAFDRTLDKL
ncbi:hypothetical protein GGI05_003688, partial [Coemansia sp. RSA 2603]